MIYTSLGAQLGALIFEVVVISNKRLLLKFYENSQNYTNEIKSTFNSIDMAMIRFENEEAKQVNKSVIELFKNTLSKELLSKLFELEQSSSNTA